MKDQRVSLQVAKLAKEKGFDWPVDKMYDKRGNLTGVKLGMHGNPNNYADFYSAPTQSLLQKWLREVHSISVSIETGWSDGNFIYEIWIWHEYSDDLLLDNYKSYEEALEKGLYQALLLIKS